VYTVCKVEMLKIKRGNSTFTNVSKKRKTIGDYDYAEKFAEIVTFFIIKITAECGM